MKNLRVSISILLCLGITLLAGCLQLPHRGDPAPSPSQPRVTTQSTLPQGDIGTLAERCSPGVVGIATLRYPQQEGGEALQGVGSGVVVHDQGYVLTNHHVIENSDALSVVFSDGSYAPAKLLWSDRVLDLAVIQTEGNFTVLPLGDSDDLRVGDAVIAIGTPLALQFQHTVTQGIVSAKDRTIMLNTAQGESFFENLIQTDASINPGNSGGPLINMDGAVVGINTLKVTEAEGLGFAIPINIAKPIVNHFITSGSFETPYIGIFAYDNRIALYYDGRSDLPEGVYLLNLDAEGPAYAAGLRKGDVIVEAQGHAISTMLDLRVQVYTLGIGRRISLKYVRDGETHTAEMKIVRNPGNG